jgi:formate--tetrahydrofolate ligase
MRKAATNMTMPSALEISRQATLKPVTEIAAEAGLPPWLIEPHREHVAKIDLAAIGELADRPRARYVLVTAITPTPLGEGKTTTTVGLGQGMRVIGTRRPGPGSSTRSAGTCAPCQV